MRVNINLATHPYEVAQSYVRRMTMVIAGLGVIALVLAGYIFYQRQNTRDINRQIADVERQMDSLDGEESQARAILNKPANHVIADQSDFLNQLFARKSLSWTRIFTEMERIVPPGLHVVSMKPEYTKTNDLILHVVVATDSRERAVEMVRNMEKSAHLRQAQIDAEAVTTNQTDQAAGGGNIQFDIAALYVPGIAENDTEPEPPAKGSGKSTASPAPAATAPVNRTAAAPVMTPQMQRINPATNRGMAAPQNQPAPSMSPGATWNPATAQPTPQQMPQTGVTSATPNYPQPGAMTPGYSNNDTASPNPGLSPAQRRLMRAHPPSGGGN
jgi:type IV pilus assembly protein PilN